MLLNLSDVLTSEGRVEQKEVPLEMTDFTSRIGKFPVTEKGSVHFTLANVEEGRARVKGNVRLVFAAECDRCLEEVPVILDIQFDRTVAAPDVSADSKEDDCPDDMDGYQLNVETFVYHEILENWPMKILCKEDCKGVCPKCGQNLNAGECGCDTFVPDPRMAVIKDIFNANKEV